MRTLWLVATLAGCLAVAGCQVDPDASAAVEGDRAPLAGSSSNSLNSPTAGPTSEGLSGGTETSAPPELDPDRGTKIQQFPGSH